MSSYGTASSCSPSKRGLRYSRSGRVTCDFWHTLLNVSPFQVGCSKSGKVSVRFWANSKRVRHRCKRHRANIWRRPGAKHCSSLCSQSEGANIVADKHELKIQRRYAPERWLYSLRVRGPHFASKVSYNAGASDLRRMFAQRLLLLCRTCYANLQMMVGLALENNPKSGKSHK